LRVASWLFDKNTGSKKNFYTPDGVGCRLNKLRLDNDSRIHELYKISNNTTGTGMYFGKSSSGYLFQGVREIDPIETSMK